ncbi:AraC family transcriptional regulator [Paenibacillus sp. S150]|uniref:AraC family transcriptional regulator n=1 Tax=Paenibacillus sp. S150 TaxID=2749826 RepID=UPI001C5599A0|nr:AraC family transcriptional regulator [Paenibacillus sp. S150]MBW4079871.1 helix-turn-helix transcriptional regulator [Paenibacillus sp. S150]
MEHSETCPEPLSAAPSGEQEPCVVDHLTDRALADFPVQCVQRCSEILQPAPHSHSGYECYLCLNGSGRFIAGNNIYEINGGSLVIVNPSVLHMPRSTGGRPLHRLILSVDKSYLDRLCQVDHSAGQLVREWLPGERDGSLLWQLNIGRLESVQEIMRQLEGELADRQEGYTLAVQSLVLRLFAVLIRPVSGQLPSRPADARMKQLSEQMIAYIAGNYRDSFRLEEMSRYFHLSRSYLHRIFKQEIGLAIKEYLMAYRINRAKELLEAGTLPLTEVAAASGFQDLSHFCRSFKRLAGVPPGHYRTMHRKSGL